MSRDSSENGKSTLNDPITTDNPEGLQKAYERPILFCYGDVRDITLGGSQNPGDPGVPGGTRRNF